MSWGECLSAISRTLGRDLTPDEDATLHAQFTNEFERIRREQELDDIDSAARQAAETVAEKSNVCRVDGGGRCRRIFSISFRKPISSNWSASSRINICNRLHPA